MSDQRTPTVFHSLSYADAPSAVEFLSAAFGFVVKGAYTDPDDASLVVHAQLDWPPGGGIMLGSARRRDASWVDSTGRGQCYCVTETDQDVDRVYARAVAAGATSVRPPRGPGLRRSRLHRARPRGQPVELRLLPGRVSVRRTLAA